ncbi:hypothetical protein B1H29_01695 [Streptomyces pactum]|uniref:Uncharacterized protein n=1 Tax=Streptomyces pactum TaxID=68249 RepID=A0A1S6J251_9ACTN|nr:hypothetical protein B1H29_01695 [Streptomyces pactum]
MTFAAPPEDAYSADDGKRLWSRDLGLKLREESGDPTMRELLFDAAAEYGCRRTRWRAGSPPS